ncbi:hypothetical protein E3P94_03848 [Wallemia ichthyophaga]|nr:hypothetical protein E3P95_03847 [Wallemia ichthyophaga]TIA96064.1 hypothetical protein E3P94_03848 [Wallemia ichthyophaga]
MSTCNQTDAANAAVFVKSDPVPDSARLVQGPDFEQPQSLQGLLSAYETIGFQATGLARAVERSWRLSDEDRAEDDDTPEEERRNTTANIFLGYTSNLISSGLREIMLFLVKNKYVNVLCTTAGGVEEDFIKCLGPGTYLPTGDGWNLDGAHLRKKGMNRIGNLLVPNEAYCRFEDWVVPILDAMREEQDTEQTRWTPSKVIHRLGKEINDERSVYYWAYKNDIPVFCPALTDGSLGDMIYFHSYKNPGLNIDLVGDIRRLNDLSVRSKKAGIIILGGGVCKHQVCNAMLFRNGADYAVYVNTGQEFDGSDAGARPDEAISWGKIRSGAESIKNMYKVRQPARFAGEPGSTRWIESRAEYRKNTKLSIWPASPPAKRRSHSESATERNDKDRKKGKERWKDKGKSREREDRDEKRKHRKLQRNVEKTEQVNSIEDIGPMPLPQDMVKLSDKDFGREMLRGEGTAMAQFVQDGQRIPRRGEIGIESGEIDKLEQAGYVMSGNRHKRMNEVRVRKENEVYTAEEKRKMVKEAAEDKMKRENEVVASFKELMYIRIFILLVFFLRSTTNTKIIMSDLGTSIGPQRRDSRYTPSKPSKPYQRPSPTPTPTQNNTASLLSSVRSLVSKPFSWLSGGVSNHPDEESAQQVQSPWSKGEEPRSEHAPRAPHAPPKAKQRPHTFYNDLPPSMAKSNHLQIPGNRQTTLSPKMSSSFNGSGSGYGSAYNNNNNNLQNSPFTPVKHPRRSLLSNGRNASPLLPRTRYRTPTVPTKDHNPLQSILSAATNDPYHSTAHKRSSVIDPSPERPSKRRMVYNEQADEFMSLEEAQARKPQPQPPKNEAERILLALEKMRTPLTDARKSNPLSARGPLPSQSQQSQQSYNLPTISIPIPKPNPAKSKLAPPVNKKAEAMISPYARSKHRREQERRHREHDLKSSKLQERLPKTQQRPRSKIAVPSDDEDEHEDGYVGEREQGDKQDNSSKGVDKPNHSSPHTAPIATTSAAKLFAPMSGQDQFKPGKVGEKDANGADKGPSATDRARSSLRARTMTSSRQHSSAARKPREDTAEIDEEEEERKRQAERDALKSVPVVNFNFDGIASQQSAPTPAPAPNPKLNFNLPEETDVKEQNEQTKPATPKPATPFSFGGESTTPKGPPPAAIFDNKDEKEKEKKDDSKPQSQPPLGFSFGAPKSEKTQKEKEEEENSKKAAAEKPNPFALFEANKKEDDKPKSVPTFSFGGTAEHNKDDKDDKDDKEETKSNPFSPGAPLEKKDENNQKNEKPAAAPASLGGFSFGKPPSQDSKPASPFSFGGAQTDEKTPSLLSRFSNKPEGKADTTDATGGDKPASPAPLFGKPAEEKGESSSSKSSAFSFGAAPSTKPASSSPFSFGGGGSSGGSFGATKPAEEEKKDDEKGTGGAFSFTKPQSDESKPNSSNGVFGGGSSGSGAAFSFGAPSEIKESKESKNEVNGGSGSFAFGQPKPAENEEKKQPTFSFGQPAKADEKSPGAAFSFGGSAPATDDNKPKSSSPFSFGAGGNDTAKPPVFGAPASAPAPASQSTEPIKPSSPFSFGASSTNPTDASSNTSKPPFAFGGSQTTLFGNSQPASTDKPTFSFGGATASASAGENKSSFAFGGGEAKPTSTSETVSSTPSFGFGGGGGSIPSFQFGGAGGTGSAGGAFGAAKPQPQQQQQSNGGGDSMEESPTRPAGSAPLFGAPATAPTSTPTPFGGGASSGGFGFGQSQPPAPAAGAGASPAFSFGGGSAPSSGASTGAFGFGAAPAPAPAPSASSTNNTAPSSPFAFGSSAPAPAPNPSTPQQAPGSPSLFNIGTGSPAPGTPNSSRPVKPLRRNRR